MSIQWTTTKPTEPNWYWYRADFYAEERILLVEETHDGSGLYASGVRGACAFVDLMHGEWAGPIPKPGVM
jgi:hypothetical protein